jgi:methylmalonyl-CoA mutase N-terminal domain/subunit
VEQAAQDYIQRIDEMGGMIPAIERSFPQQEIANASFRYQRSVESRERIIVGMNGFEDQEESEPLTILEIDESAAREQCERLEALRARREEGAVRSALEALRRGVEGTENTMPLILNSVRAYATLGEICDALREVFGTYEEKSVL